MVVMQGNSVQPRPRREAALRRFELLCRLGVLMMSCTPPLMKGDSQKQVGMYICSFFTGLTSIPFLQPPGPLLGRDQIESRDRKGARPKRSNVFRVALGEAVKTSLRRQQEAAASGLWQKRREPFAGAHHSRFDLISGQARCRHAGTWRTEKKLILHRGRAVGNRAETIPALPAEQPA